MRRVGPRVVTNSGTLDGTAHYVHDRGGNVIAELNAAGATAREYIWLPEAEIAPTAASRATIDRPVAVVDGGQGFSHTALFARLLLVAPARARCLRSGGPWPSPVRLVADRLARYGGRWQ